MLEVNRMEYATITYLDQQFQVESGITIRVALEEKLNMDPYAVLALRERKLINDRTMIEPGDEITLVNVINGG